MKSKQTTFDSKRTQPLRPPTGSVFAIAMFVVASLHTIAMIGCTNSAAKAGSDKPIPSETNVDPSPNAGTLTGDSKTGEIQTGETQDVQSGDKPKRLARGEMPKEWIEPQRERIIPMDRSGDKLDLTFDDLKFDIEIGEPFERSLLSEEVKALDGKEITLGGYMRPSFRASGLKGFIFVRDDKECCFGPQAAIYDCVRVKLKKGTTSNYIVQPFKVRGSFYLKEREGPDGAIWSIFNMKDVEIVR